jgi:hypothetical protein
MPDKDEAAGSSPARPTTPALSCGNARRWWNEIAAAPVRRHCIAVSERILRSAGPPRSWASELAAWLHLWFECGGGRVAEAAQGRSGRATVRRAGAPALFPPQSLEASALVRPAPIAGREHVGSSRTSTTSSWTPIPASPPWPCRCARPSWRANPLPCLREGPAFGTQRADRPDIPRPSPNCRGARGGFGAMDIADEAVPRSSCEHPHACHGAGRRAAGKRPAVAALHLRSGSAVEAVSWCSSPCRRRNGHRPATFPSMETS